MGKEENLKTTIAIIIGGKSVEHDISILSGLQVYHAIDKEKYHVLMIYITKDNKWLIGNDLKDINTYKLANFKNCKEILVYNSNNNIQYIYLNKPKKRNKIDIFIPVVHGEGVEDGTLAGYLDLINATYTAPKLLPAAIAQDKAFTKIILEYYGIKTVQFITLKKADFQTDSINQIVEILDLPVIVKPVRLGSSIGIFKCNNYQELEKNLIEAFKYSDKLIIEKCLENIKEYNCAAIKEGDRIHISCIEEVFPSKDILSFVDKYENNLDKMSDATNRMIPALIPKQLKDQIEEWTKKCYINLDLNGVVRIDYIYDENKDELYFNEVNTIPGSMAFYLFEKTGINFTSLVDILIKDALLERQKNAKKIKSFSSNVLSKTSSKLNNK